jgi:hypothetical protein
LRRISCRAEAKGLQFRSRGHRLLLSLNGPERSGEAIKEWK